MKTDHRPLIAAGLILAERRSLRLFTLFLFYLNQGIAPGFFLFALPAWLAINGVSTVGVATIVSAAGLPWAIKFLNGFVIDRYTFLPMGRRRAWIIGAQGALLGVMIAGAVLSPQPSDVALLATLGFAANLAVNFQDVGIDALAIDLMPEEERAQAAGMMLGAQVIGLALTMSLAGWALEHFGFAAGILSVAIIPAVTIAYGCVIRERKGERRLPWSAGTTHHANRTLQIRAWKPLLAGAFRALFAPLSLAYVPFLLLRSLPAGVFETYLPRIATGAVGWSLSTYTSLLALLALASGLYALLIGSKVVERLGERRVFALCGGALAAWIGLFALLSPLWGKPAVLIGFVVVAEILIMTYTIALVPVAMRLCGTGVAATQFVVYMGLSGIGRPIGALLASVAVDAGAPQAMFVVLAGCMGAVGIYALKARMGTDARSVSPKDVAGRLPQSSGIPPRFD